MGVALLLFAPLGVWLLTTGYPTLAGITGVSMLWLAMLPDVDQRLPGVPHRGPTHSLLFAALVGAVFGVAFDNLDALLGIPTPGPASEVGFAVGAVTVLAHLAGDVLTPAGVNFLWPLDWTVSLGVTRADSTIWNTGLLGLGVLINVAVFGRLFGFL